MGYHGKEDESVNELYAPTEDVIRSRWKPQPEAFREERIAREMTYAKDLALLRKLLQAEQEEFQLQAQVLFDAHKVMAYEIWAKHGLNPEVGDYW